MGEIRPAGSNKPYALGGSEKDYLFAPGLASGVPEAEPQIWQGFALYTSLGSSPPSYGIHTHSH